jgi:hypothetical protein
LLATPATDNTQSARSDINEEGGGGRTKKRGPTRRGGGGSNRRGASRQTTASPTSSAYNDVAQGASQQSSHGGTRPLVTPSASESEKTELTTPPPAVAPRSTSSPSMSPPTAQAVSHDDSNPPGRPAGAEHAPSAMEGAQLLGTDQRSESDKTEQEAREREDKRLRRQRKNGSARKSNRQERKAEEETARQRTEGWKPAGGPAAVLRTGEWPAVQAGQPEEFLYLINAMRIAVETEDMRRRSEGRGQRGGETRGRNVHSGDGSGQRAAATLKLQTQGEHTKGRASPQAATTATGRYAGRRGRGCTVTG